MVRYIILCAFVLLTSCKQAEPCCDIDIAGNLDWPSSGNYSYVSSSADSSHSVISSPNLDGNNSFNSSIEEMQPVFEETSVNSETNTSEMVGNTFDTSETTDNTFNTEAIETADNTFDTEAIETADNTFFENNSNLSNDETNLDFEVIIESPSKIYVGSTFDYNIKIKNVNSEPLKDVSVKQTLSELLEYVDSNLAASQNEKDLEWRIDEISPYATRTFSVTAKSTGNGMAKLMINADVNGSNKSAESYVLVDTSIGLKIDHIDLNDPVEVGEEVVYQVEIVNQGNKAASNILVVDIIPEETSFVRASIEFNELVNYNFVNGKVAFDAISRLEAQQKIVFEIVVKVERVGDLLNTVEVSTNDFDKTVRSQEGTKSFQE